MKIALLIKASSTEMSPKSFKDWNYSIFFVFTCLQGLNSTDGFRSSYQRNMQASVEVFGIFGNTETYRNQTT